jgi:hypothetical protein
MVRKSGTGLVPGKPKTTIIILLMVMILMTGGALAQWTGVFSATQKSQSKAGELSPASFAASAPAKEIVYLGGKPIVTEEPPGNCTVVLLTNSQSFAANGGSGSVSVTAGNGCPWTAVSNDTSWLNITSGASGSGNGTVQYSVTAHTTTNIRNATLTIGGQTFTVYQGKAFTDVPVGAPFYNEISRLSARQVTLGCTTSTFCPGQTVTREQMAAFIIRALGELNPPTPPTQRFTDVPPAHPFYNFIDRMAVLGITLGCSPTTYCPGDTVTHEQMAAFLIRALGMPNPPTPATQRFTDVAPTHPFYGFIDQMAERGIWGGCNGVPGSTYCPSSLVTREQMAALLVRAFNL